MDYRIEYDGFGEIHLPQTALYNAQTQRAVENFSFSERTMPVSFLAQAGQDQAGGGPGQPGSR